MYKVRHGHDVESLETLILAAIIEANKPLVEAVLEHNRRISTMEIEPESKESEKMRGGEVDLARKLKGEPDAK
jgi:hypothetical protein